MDTFTKQVYKSFIDERGELTPIELNGLTPERIFYITGIPKGTERGNHAHRNTFQWLICQQGQVNVTIRKNDFISSTTLSKNEGLIIEPMIWTTETFLTGNDVLLVLCNTHYDENDYIRDWETYKREAKIHFG